MAEIKTTAIAFVKNRWGALLQSSHLFHGNESYINGEGWCHIHNQQCQVHPGVVDICVAGLPCKAFSRLRHRGGDSARTQSAAKHPVFATVEQFIEYAQARSPNCFLIEEVESFGHVVKDLKHRGLPESHLSRWSRELSRLGHAIKVVKYQHGIYVQCRRPRLLIIGCSARCGGSEGAAWLADAVVASQRRRAMQKPCSVWQLVDPDCVEEEEIRRRDLAEKRKQAGL